MAMFDLWWVWIVAGFALGVLEVLVPGFIFLGFAIGAVCIGILIGVGVLIGGPPAMLMVFAVISVLAWLCLRRFMGVREGQVKIWHKDIND